MPTFKNAEEMVAWILADGDYEPLALAEGSPILRKLQRLEREARLVTQDEGTVILALTKKKVAA